MPKGVPKNGYRMTKKRLKNKGAIPPAFKRKAEVLAMKPQLVVSNETDAQIWERISTRFDILSTLTHATVTGESRALIVSGPAGLGKSYTVEDTLKEWDPNGVNHTFIKGFVKATGLYKLLYQHREAGKVLVFDDADSIFYDDVSLNMLKAVCDTTEIRRVSYLAEGSLVDEDSAERIPKSFEFNGAIIFITNLDFDHLIDRGHKLAPHLQALISRSHYIDLAMRTKRDYIIRIKQVIDQGLLDSFGLYSAEQKEVIDFITQNSEQMRELSLRSALKIAALRKTGGPKWKNIATVTCCRNS